MARQPSEFTDNSRPLGVTVTLVLCILGGALGILIGLLGIAQLLLAPQIANMSITKGSPQADAQMQMQQEMQAITQQFMIPTILNIIVTTALSACLFVGGISLLRRKSWSSNFLRRVFSAAIIFEILRGFLYVFIQMQMIPVMENFMTEIAQGNKGGGPATAQFISVSIYIGIAFWAVWAIIKIGMLAWGRSYLNRPIARQFLNKA